ncbi:hypothetical protein ABH944_006194 [Caballeronia udeis]|uniref:Uncharacterized protein n=1 Tax=Caballeronia udeis TaxID=1232866 RepID=A0ABW8MR30_9BURK
MKEPADGLKSRTCSTQVRRRASLGKNYDRRACSVGDLRPARIVSRYPDLTDRPSLIQRHRPSLPRFLSWPCFTFRRRACLFAWWKSPLTTLPPIQVGRRFWMLLSAWLQLFVRCDASIGRPSSSAGGVSNRICIGCLTRLPVGIPVIYRYRCTVEQRDVDSHGVRDCRQATTQWWSTVLDHLSQACLDGSLNRQMTAAIGLISFLERYEELLDTMYWTCCTSSDAG